MTSRTAAIAAVRFGTGLSPHLAAPGDAAAVMTSLSGPDEMLVRFPRSSFEEITGVAMALRRERLRQQELGVTDQAALKPFLRSIQVTAARALATDVARGLDSQRPFFERLVRFWADHFTVAARNRAERGMPSAFADVAIRPFVTGSFADLLEAAVLHPAMLVYLDQTSSFGPGSRVGRKRGRGLNENLAREVLELHTLGVGGGYSQRDVREFAELLTGLSYRRRDGFRFRPGIAEPGAEHVLGRDYGGGKPKLDDIRAALFDIAHHPDTAAHIGRKLVAHFCADTPDPSHVAHVAAAFRDGKGDLPSVYAALLEHPAAWSDFGQKAKPPFDYMLSALRALGVDGQRIANTGPRDVNLLLHRPMRTMGQSFEQPAGPDGWPDTFADWIHPQGLAARIQWGMTAPGTVLRDLPDPRDLVEVALGPLAGPDTRMAAHAAETRWEGVGLVLASADFNRR